MKLLKGTISLFIILVILNHFGMLDRRLGKQVERAVDVTSEMVNNIKYKGKSITDMSLKELSGNIIEDITYLKEEIVTDDGLKLKGKKLTVEVSPANTTIIKAKVDGRDAKAVKALEEVINSLTGLNYNLPEEMKDKMQVNININKSENGGYQVDVTQTVIENEYGIIIKSMDGEGNIATITKGITNMDTTPPTITPTLGD